MSREIEIADLRQITEIVRSKHDYDFTNYAMSSFKRRVSRMLDLFNLSVDSLLKKLEEEPAFIDEFLKELTVNVTEMFRDPTFWITLRDDIIPSILVNHDKFNIWHAGCSSGEEVISMAILLEEMGLTDKVSIYATDIDQVILDRAMRAEYSLKNMDLNEKNYIRFEGKRNLRDYYTVKNNLATMKPELIRNVKFKKHDLVKGPTFSKVDLVLCRNVMIYFNQKLQNDVLKRFHESLFKYGYLAIGSKESLIWCDIAHKFIVVNKEEKVYRKLKE